MVPNQKRGKPAETHLVLERRFGHFCLVQAAPLTGRQHQIRVHLAAIGYPLAVDFLYGRRERLDGREFNRIVGRPELPPERTLLDRCPLHAARIEYRHPQSGEPMAAEAPLPSDMKRVLEALESHDPPA
jgi:23S rRNA-/tRNA-specific pseudouridylate synthase